MPDRTAAYREGSRRSSSSVRPAASGREPSAAYREVSRRERSESRLAREGRERQKLRRNLQRRRQFRRRLRIILTVLEVAAVLCFAVLLLSLFKLSSRGSEAGAVSGDLAWGGLPQLGFSGSRIQGIDEEVFNRHPEWTENYLTPNEYSRPGEALTEVKTIFVHYTANPGTSAAQNRSYFEQQKDMHQASVSSHFIIGYDGEILQILPLDEIGYAVKTRNYDSISIECCYKSENGQFTQETYDSLIALLSWLTEAYDLDSEDILRHYDCGGKKCPLYFVDHEDAWERLKKDVEEYGAKG